MTDFSSNSLSPSKSIITITQCLESGSLTVTSDLRDAVYDQKEEGASCETDSSTTEYIHLDNHHPPHGVEQEDTDSSFMVNNVDKGTGITDIQQILDGYCTIETTADSHQPKFIKRYSDYDFSSLPSWSGL